MRDAATVSSSQSDLDNTIAFLTSCLSSLENLLSMHNIALPINALPSETCTKGLAGTGGPTGDGAPSGNHV